MKKKMVTLCLVVALVLTAAIGGTMAYFTDYTDTATNTFTVGNVDIELDEADVDEYGVVIDPQDRVLENTYKLVPGHTYVKDPTVTVIGGSEACLVRMFVTFTKAAELKAVLAEDDADFLPELFVGNTWDKNVWECVGYEPGKDNTIVFEFRYNGVVPASDEDNELDALFEAFTLPADLTTDEVAQLEGLKITVYAEAIQANDVTNVEEAWGTVLDNDQVKKQVN